MKHPILSTVTAGMALCLTMATSAPLAIAQGAPEAQPEELPAEPTAPPAADADADGFGRLLVVPIAGRSAEMIDAAARITTALTKAATDQGLSVETSAASRAQITDLSDCKSEAPECMQAMLDAVSADTIVLGSLVQTEGGWILTLKQVRRGQADKITTHVLQGKDPALLDSQVAELSKIVFGGETATPDPVVPDPNPTKPPPPVVAPRESGFDLGRVNTAAWAVTGAGVGIAAVGATFLVLASGKQSDVDSAPDATLDDINKLRDLEDTAEKHELFGNSFLIAGAVTSVAGLTWVVLQAKSGSKEAPTAILAPSPTQGGAMVTLTLLQ